MVDPIHMRLTHSLADYLENGCVWYIPAPRRLGRALGLDIEIQDPAEGRNIGIPCETKRKESLTYAHTLGELELE